MDNTAFSKSKKREGFLGQRMVVVPESIRRVIRENALINSLYLTDIGYYPQARNHYRKRKNGTSEYILIYCLEGQGWVKMSSEEYNLRPNSYFIIPANTAHEYWANKQNPWTIFWVHYTGELAKTFFERNLKRNTVEQEADAIQIAFEEERLTCFKGLISVLEDGYSSENIEYVNITLKHLLASFIYHDYYSELRHANRGDKVIGSAITYMQENIKRSLSVDELSDHLNYSTSYLYSLFKKGTGYSPINYFNHLKIQKACNYLSFTDMTIKEISFELGFNDPFYFSRLFKKYMEISPTQYRKNIQ